MSNKFITFVVPTLNSENNLERALLSLAPLSEFANIIVVDGFSEDNTLKIVETFKSRGLDILVEQRKPMGVYDAMNIGISSCNTDYIYFLNSDDECNIEVIEKLRPTLLRDNYDLVVFSMLYESKRGFVKSSAMFNTSDLFPQVSHQQLIFAKRLYEKIGTYRTDLKISSDYDLFCRLQKQLGLGHGFRILDATHLILTKFYQGGMSSRSSIKDQWDLFIIEKEIRLSSAVFRFIRNSFLVMGNRIKRSVF